MVIPDWNRQHVIPPVRAVPPEQQGLRENRSPYDANLCEVVHRFAFTPERIQLLHQPTDYRNALYAVGVTKRERQQYFAKRLYDTANNRHADQMGVGDALFEPYRDPTASRAQRDEDIRQTVKRSMEK